uniref:Uncharacterized protein n=1 Tax=Setaria italica TaxID=4555 RepID=K3ZGJ7_SETIT
MLLKSHRSAKQRLNLEASISKASNHSSALIPCLILIKHLLQHQQA